MEWRRRAAAKYRRQALAKIGRGAALALAVALHAVGGNAAAATLSPRDVQVLGRVLAFLQSPPAGGDVAIVYAHGDAASRQDAEAIAAEIGDGLHVGNATLRPRPMDSAALSAGGFAVVIAAAGASTPQLRAAIDRAHALCVTADLSAVTAGFCTMAIRSDPRVEIVVNHAVAVASGVEFAAAFRMMIREI